MKKRLLSAALALAMVLTLLPLSAFAATPAFTLATGDNVQYFDRNNSNMSGLNGGAGWYAYRQNADNKTEYVKLNSGVVIGSKYLNETSIEYGKAYTAASPNTGTVTASGTITVIGSSVSIEANPSGGTTNNTSLNIDLWGPSSSVTVNDTGKKLTSLTITSSKYVSEGQTTRPSVTLGTNVASIDDRAFTLNLTDVQSTSGVTWSQPTSNGTQNYSRTINLANATLKGTISMTGNGAKDANGKSVADAAQYIYANRYQNSSQQVSNEIGNITMTGNGSRIELTDTNFTGTGRSIELTGTGAQVVFSGNSYSGGIMMKGDITSTAAVNAAPPSVTVNKGSSLWSIEYDGREKCNQEARVTVAGGTVHGATGGIKVPAGKANVTVSDGGNVAGPVSINTGRITVSGAYSKVGDVSMKEEATFDLTGNHCSVGKIEVTNANSCTVNIPADDTNTLGSEDTTSLENYSKATVKGGTWRVKQGNDKKVVGGVNPAALASVAYKLTNFTAGERTYYPANQLGEALTKQKSANLDLRAFDDPEDGGSSKVEFRNGDVVWGTFSFRADTQITLPAKVNNIEVANWFDGTHSYPGGGQYDVVKAMVGKNDDGTEKPITLNAQGGAVSGDATKLTRIAVVQAGSTASTGVRGDLNGNVISLSGAVVKGRSSFQVKLTTDAVDTDGTLWEPIVTLSYDSSTSNLTFANGQDEALREYGMSFKTDAKGLSILRMSNGTEYTLNGSQLKVRAGTIHVVGDTSVTDYPNKDSYSHIEVNVNVSGYNTVADKKRISDLLDDKTKSCAFEWTNSPVMLQAVNAALATVTDQEVSQWITQAKQKAWSDNDRGTYDATKVAPYDKVYLVPYLQINVTDYKPEGSLTATLVPSWRVELHANTTDSKLYKVKDNDTVYRPSKGGALTGISGDLTGEQSGQVGVKVTFNLGTNFSVMHQDGTYDYKVSGKTFTITHAGNNGLGSIIINNTEPLISLYAKGDHNNGAPTSGKTPKAYYSNLQAAVDDVLEDELIIVDQNFKGSTTVSVTGLAREFDIQANGNTLVIANATGGLVTENSTGTLHHVKLNRNTEVVKTGNITINSATGGSASVSKNPANYGDTVTITLSASTGYTPSGVTVRDANNNAVTVSGSGSTYTFTMPSGSVTVTPSFTRTQQANATIVVSNTTSGTATTSAGNNQVAPGTQVTVTTTPATGRRTMGLYVTGATATRTGANTFTFTVPSGYTTVTVTPRFDVNNGTLFEDVWSTEYYSTPVAWAVGRGITQGDGSVYRFGTGKTCTREDMVTFLWRSQGSPVVNVSNPFWDVQPGSYYYNAVLWAVSKGITKGISANQFGVGRNVIRADAVTFLYRMAGSPAASSTSSFYDVPSNQYYAKAVNWAVSKGITNGDGSTVRFNPYGNCLREQIVTFLYRDLV